MDPALGDGELLLALAQKLNALLARQMEQIATV
jgi:hypothetical protein